MEYGFLGVILGLVSVVLVRVSYMAKELKEMRAMLEKRNGGEKKE